MDAGILMYAPTFRESANQGKRTVFAEEWTLDFHRLIEALEKKTQHPWYICLRVHPQLASQFAGQMPKKDKVINGSDEDDMYELLAGMDAYITDYSSAAFEAAYANIPVFIYADDMEQYAHDRGQLMWNIVGEDADGQTRVPDMDAPFPFEIARDNEEMEKLILNFDQATFIQRIETFKTNIGLTFDGKGSQRVAEQIQERMG
jgi:CDP-glycerol glycerophosphotransferase